MLLCCPQSDVAYEYFRDTFVLSTKSAYKKGEQVGPRRPACRAHSRGLVLPRCCSSGHAPGGRCRPALSAAPAYWLDPHPPTPYTHTTTTTTHTHTHSTPTFTHPAFRCHAPQVFISYGAQSNGSLLQYYAFTERGNPNDVYVWQASIGGQEVQVSGGQRGHCLPRQASGCAGRWQRQQAQIHLIAISSSADRGRPAPCAAPSPAADRERQGQLHSRVPGSGARRTGRRWRRRRHGEAGPGLARRCARQWLQLAR